MLALHSSILKRIKTLSSQLFEPFLGIRAAAMKKIVAATVIAFTGSHFEQAIAADDVKTSYPEKIYFQDLFNNKDINIGEVEVTLQDYQGYIWLGGRNAILRYDGSEFLPFEVQVDNQDSSQNILATQAVDLFEDSRQRLWVATRTGVLWFDRENQVFKKLEEVKDSKKNIDTGTINKIIEASTGEIIIASYAGLTVISSDNSNVTIYDMDTTQGALNNNVIHDIIRDPNGNFWLANEKGLHYFNWKNKSFSAYLPNPDDINNLPDNDIWAIEFDSDGNIWAGSHSGIYKFNTKTKIFKKYQHDPTDNFSIGANLIREVTIDSKGFNWVGTDGGGLNLYDKVNDRFIRFSHQKGQKGSLASNSTRAIFEDRNGDLWVGTYPAGINFFDRSSGAISLYNSDPNNTNSLPHNSVLTLQEDDKGNLWLGTDGGGVSYFDRFANTFTHYQVADKKISSNAILSSLMDSKGNFWVGTWGGAVNRYNPTTDNFDKIPFDLNLKGQGSGTYKALNDEAVWNIYEDKKGEIWIGTHSGGLSLYNQDTGTFTNYSHDRAIPTTISNQLVWTTFEDSKNRFWVGTANGLDLFDRETAKGQRITASDDDPNSLSNNSVLCIFEDSKKRLWFGTDWGLNQLNDDNDNISFTVYGNNENFVDNGIRSITEDANGNLWLGTNNGIVMFNPDTKSVNNYKRAGGQQLGGFNTGSVLISQRGEVIFGGTNGVRLFNISELSTNELPPPVTLTDFKVFTKSIAVNGPDKLLSKTVNLTNTITLDYKKNMFSFNFSALNYRDSDKNQYAYKLEGFDKNWREVGNQRSALYTNLDGGSYVFKVKGSNNDGVWNEEGKSITIIQLPPPWKTWWAYTLYVLAILGTILRFIYAQRKKRKIIERQKQKLEVKVAERTSELREKNHDIQAMLGNMRQGLFTVEPSGNIHPEYSSFLEDIFHTKEIAARNAMDLLFTGANIGGDSLNQAKEAIKSIIGEDEMNFSFNSNLLPTEYSITREQATQHLSLDWDPIIIDDCVSKLMVSVRDVTALKQAEGAALAQKRELNIISQLIKVPNKKYLAFEESARKFIQENREKIQASPQKDLDVIALLFRNMHTIKGNCRTYGFSYYSDVVHNVETTYSELKASDEYPWEQQILLDDLVKVELAAKEYAAVYYDVLGRGDNSADESENPLLDVGTIAHIQKCISEVSKTYPEAGRSTQLQSASILLNIALSNTMSKVLADIVNSLPSIAKQLGKADPKVMIDDSNVRIKSSAHELLNNVFAHILRNSVDHGIESPEDREKQGKPGPGRIDVFTSLRGDNLRIHVKDDGKGVNIDRLYQKGLEMGVWKTGETPATAAIAELIFASGTSTKDEVSAISGRGVGMDAVKQFLRNAGGDIELNLLDDKEPNNAFVAFETIISLPPSTFTVIKYEG